MVTRQGTGSAYSNVRTMSRLRYLQHTYKKELPVRRKRTGIPLSHHPHREQPQGTAPVPDTGGMGLCVTNQSNTRKSIQPNRFLQSKRNWMLTDWKNERSKVSIWVWLRRRCKDDRSKCVYFWWGWKSPIGIYWLRISETVENNLPIAGIDKPRRANRLQLIFLCVILL